MRKRLFGVVALTAAATLFVHAPVAAQSYPTAGKPITIVVPFTAGGPTDKVARDFAQSLSKQLDNASVVIDNAAGAGSSIGTSKAARARKDGYTLLLNHIGMSTMPSLYRRLPFNVMEDFEFVGIINDVPMTLIGRPNLEANQYEELAEWMKTQPTGVNLGNAGLGSASHLCGLMFEKASGVEMVSVPYSGTAPAIADLIGGQIDLLCDQTTNTTPQIVGQKVKSYAVTTPAKLTVDPYKETPTLAESGLADFNVTIWHGLYAPKGTPPETIERLNVALKNVLEDPEFIQRQNALGAVVAKVDDPRVSPEGHKQFVAAEIDKWTEVIKAAGQFAD